ncbi:ABC transporter ATP-binding protein [Metabacillus litoralis]|uniref:ABC transporter ATP-binding protein n=1 Tax=Metabacillus litoralis TaxID=152268 RepID=A0A5C6W889_9BACI|nr:ABC transporter ATP-binding protein [Metabacillus litoralis]
MIKGFLEKLLNSKQQTVSTEKQYISEDQVQAIVDQRLKEHASTLQQTTTSTEEEEHLLTAKQIDYALSLVHKIDDFILAIDPAKLTVKDLNRLIAYNRYKNKGTVVNLVKKGVLRKK